MKKVYIIAFALLALLSIVCFEYGRSINEVLSNKDGYVMR